jgi:nitrogen regulatory protein PII
MKNGYKCIFAVVNNGFSEEAMDAARAAGAKGGTILHGRGTISKEAEKFFNITIQPEKEIVMILAKSEDIDPILKALYAAIGTSSSAQGIAFALPVDEVVGLDAKTVEKTVENNETQEK